jgi:hypothetical protein
MHKKRKKSTNCSNSRWKAAKQRTREREREDEGEEEDETRKLTIDDEDMRITSQQTSRMMKQKARRGKAQHFW